LTIVDENAELVETWSWYDVAPGEAFQLNVGLVAMLVVPFAGEASMGEGGTVGATDNVVKMLLADHALVPVEFVPFTRQ
jgi:hypothetical protein